MSLYFPLLFSLSYSYTSVPPFGSILGQNNHVISYSNGSPNLNSSEPNSAISTFSGMKWDCIEYARRWLIISYGFSFSNFSGAISILSQCSFTNIHTGLSVSHNIVQNGAFCKPVVGNLIVYSSGKSSVSSGHLAVVTAMTETGVKIAEQNWDNMVWPGDYSRNLSFSIVNQKYYLSDPPYTIVGWVEYEGTYSSCSGSRYEAYSLACILLSLAIS